MTAHSSAICSTLAELELEPLQVRGRVGAGVVSVCCVRVRVCANWEGASGLAPHATTWPGPSKPGRYLFYY